MYFAGRSPAPVGAALPVGHPWNLESSFIIEGPAARWMAPSTPPPPDNAEFAALTIASTGILVISPVTILSFRPFGKVRSMPAIVRISMAQALVLFDIDGTLVRRAGPLHRESLVEAVRRATGLDTTTDGVPTQGMLDRDIVTEMLRNAGASRAYILRNMPQIVAKAQSI